MSATDIDPVQARKAAAEAALLPGEEVIYDPANPPVIEELEIVDVPPRTPAEIRAAFAEANAEFVKELNLGGPAAAELLAMPGRHEDSCLSVWFPRLVAGNVPVPKTEIVRWPGASPYGLANLLCYGELEGDEKAQFDREFDQFANDLHFAADKVGGWPCFLRTGQTSNKHNWKETCCWTDPKLLDKHVTALVEFSQMVDIIALPHDVWVAREFLQTRPVAYLPRYGDMPLVREYRGFVRDGKVVCVHPYWPVESIMDGLDAAVRTADRRADFEEFVGRAAPAEVFNLLYRVAQLFAGDGAWSVDVLETALGWYVTDMATAGQSFHWAGCPRAASFQVKA